MRWTISTVSDMCVKENAEIIRGNMDMSYYDENTWEVLDEKLVEKAEKEELERFVEMDVYEYVDKQKALEDVEGKFVKVKWVRTNKGTVDEPKVRCRLVSQALGFGERLDELFAGTPSLGAVRLAIAFACRREEGGPKLDIMILDVKCAFLYGLM